MTYLSVYGTLLSVVEDRSSSSPKDVGDAFSRLDRGPFRERTSEPLGVWRKTEREMRASRSSPFTKKRTPSE